jgi:hypothetical protein
MTRSLTVLALVAALLLPVLPATTHAASSSAKHSLPKPGTGLNIVYSFGVTGGNIRPWNVNISLDGTVHSSGITPSVQQLPDAKNTLKALMALADAQGFFSMQGTNSCKGSIGTPDSGSHNIAVTSSTGTKRVSVFGSCKGKFNGLYDLLEAVAGIPR